MGEAVIIRNSTPESYGRWLSGAAERQASSLGRDGIVFVNAWNEWGEGAHLEPDVFWGRAYLETTRDVLRDLFGVQEDPSEPMPEAVAPASTEDLYHDLHEQFVALQRWRSGLLSYSDRRLRELREHYEALLAESGREAREIADLNQELAERLAFQAQQLKDLGVGDVGSVDWLLTEPRP
jgi:hypothetical protein